MLPENRIINCDCVNLMSEEYKRRKKKLFTGSGTTVVVAAQLGRRYLGIDISKHYVEQGLARLRESKDLFNMAGA